MVQQQLILVNITLNNANTTTVLINNLQFQPTEMIVRGVMVCDANSTGGAAIVYSDLVNQDPIISFPTLDTVPTSVVSFFQCEIHFSISKPVYGSYTFTLVNPSTVGAALYIGTYVLHLEFIA